MVFTIDHNIAVFLFLLLNDNIWNVMFYHPHFQKICITSFVSVIANLSASAELVITKLMTMLKQD